MTEVVRHEALSEKNPDRPYKIGCTCGGWYYDWHAHIERVESGEWDND